MRKRTSRNICFGCHFDNLYDGYYTKSGERIYNPRSDVLSLSNNNLGNYWTNSGPYDEI